LAAFFRELADRDCTDFDARRDAEHAHPRHRASPRASTADDRERRIEGAEQRLRERGVMT